MAWLRLLIAGILLSGIAAAQGIRVDSAAVGPKGPLPNVTVTLCTGSATGIPCSPTTQSFTDSTLVTNCASGSAVTLSGSTSCQGTTDPLGNFGFWLAGNTTYKYCLTGPALNGNCYTITTPLAGTSPALTSPTITGTDSGNETLINKVLLGTGVGNSVTLLNEQGPVTAITGTGADAVLFTFSLPAAAMQVARGLHLTTFFNHSTGTASTVYKTSFGGTTYVTLTTTATGLHAIDLYIFNNNGSTTAQHGYGWTFTNGVGFGTVNGTSAINTNNAVTIQQTFNVANTDAVTPVGWLVQLIQ